MVIADTILMSDAVFTGLNQQAEPAGIAIKENKILAVDSKEAIKQYRGDITRVIDFSNQLIMPGIHDAHLHLMFGSLFTHESIDLSAARSAEEAAQQLTRFANDHPEFDWIIGYGWDHTNWGHPVFPTKEELDREVGDRPALLFHAEGHYTWVNSKALELANITSETEPPPYGIIHKDLSGQVTGILIETATNLVAKIALDFSEERRNKLFEDFLHQAARLGVTSVNDLFASAFDGLNEFDLYKRYEDAGKLTTRIHLYPELNGDLEKALAMRKRYQSPKLQLAGLKQFIDGVVTGHTAYMLDPYLDKPATTGEPAFDAETIKEWVKNADQAGFQIRFHTIGDGAVRLGLDAFEEAQQANGVRDSRHNLEHIEVIHPSDIGRFNQLGVVPSIQPSHLALMPKESHTLRVGKEKDDYTYLCKTLRDAVSHMAFSTDYPITALNPMKEIYYAVTRNDFNNHPWNEREKVTLAEALSSYTLGSAYSTFRDQELGTLEKGKLADIIVLDRNLFEIEPEEIVTTQVALTMVDGQIVYQK